MTLRLPVDTPFLGLRGGPDAPKQPATWHLIRGFPSNADDLKVSDWFEFMASYSVVPAARFHLRIYAPDDCIVYFVTDEPHSLLVFRPLYLHRWAFHAGWWGPHGSALAIHTPPLDDPLVQQEVKRNLLKAFAEVPEQCNLHIQTGSRGSPPSEFLSESVCEAIRDSEEDLDRTVAEFWASGGGPIPVKKSWPLYVGDALSDIDQLVRVGWVRPRPLGDGALFTGLTEWRAKSGFDRNAYWFDVHEVLTRLMARGAFQHPGWNPKIVVEDGDDLSIAEPGASLKVWCARSDPPEDRIRTLDLRASSSDDSDPPLIRLYNPPPLTASPGEIDVFSDVIPSDVMHLRNGRELRAGPSAVEFDGVSWREESDPSGDPASWRWIDLEPTSDTVAFQDEAWDALLDAREGRTWKTRVLAGLTQLDERQVFLHAHVGNTSLLSDLAEAVLFHLRQVEAILGQYKSLVSETPTTIGQNAPVQIGPGPDGEVIEEDGIFHEEVLYSTVVEMASMLRTIRRLAPPESDQRGELVELTSAGSDDRVELALIPFGVVNSTLQDRAEELAAQFDHDFFLAIEASRDAETLNKVLDALMATSVGRKRLETTLRGFADDAFDGAIFTSTRFTRMWNRSNAQTREKLSPAFFKLAWADLQGSVFPAAAEMNPADAGSEDTFLTKLTVVVADKLAALEDVDVTVSASLGELDRNPLSISAGPATKGFSAMLHVIMAVLAAKKYENDPTGRNFVGFVDSAHKSVAASLALAEGLYQPEGASRRVLMTLRRGVARAAVPLAVIALGDQLTDIAPARERGDHRQADLLTASAVAGAVDIGLLVGHTAGLLAGGPVFWVVGTVVTITALILAGVAAAAALSPLELDVTNCLLGDNYLGLKLDPPGSTEDPSLRLDNGIKRADWFRNLDLQIAHLKGRLYPIRPYDGPGMKSVEVSSLSEEWQDRLSADGVTGEILLIDVKPTHVLRGSGAIVHVWNEWRDRPGQRSRAEFTLRRGGPSRATLKDGWFDHWSYWTKVDTEGRRVTRMQMVLEKGEEDDNTLATRAAILFRLGASLEGTLPGTDFARVFFTLETS